MKHSIIATIILFFINSCGELADENKQSADTQTNSTLQPNAQNSTVDEKTNAVGSIGQDTKFGDNEKITNGIWSLYVNRNIAKDLDYDTYLGGYKFFDDGTLESRMDTITPIFRQKRETWGVNSAGSAITIRGGSSYTYAGQFDSERNCYVVSGLASSERGKFCHEDGKNAEGSLNELGFFGTDVTYGTYKRSDIIVEGSWELFKINKSVASDLSKKIQLKSDGFVNGENKILWAVSEDGKVLFVGDDAYLIYKYLDNNCFRTIHYINNVFKDEYKICKI